MSEIEALGYLGLEVSDLGRWATFASTMLGLQVVENGPSQIDLRMDDYAWRLRLSEGALDDLTFMGWEVKDAARLTALTRRLESAGSRSNSYPPRPQRSAVSPVRSASATPNTTTTRRFSDHCSAPIAR